MDGEQLSSTAELGAAIIAEARRIARTAAHNALDGVLPSVKEVQPEIDMVTVVTGALRRAREWAEDEAVTGHGGAVPLLLQVQDAIALLRKAELRQNPFATDVYASAEALLAALPDQVSVAICDDRILAACRRILASGAAALRAGASKRFWGRDGAVQAALETLRVGVPVVRRDAEAMIAGRLLGLLAETLAPALAIWQQQISASADAIAALRAARRVKLQEAAETSAVARGVTEAGHLFSRPPGRAVLHAYAVSRRGGLLDGGARPTARLWLDFGGWLADGDCFAPEEGPTTTERALGEYLALLAEEIFPDQITLAALYRGAGIPLPVNDWEELAAPRIKVGLAQVDTLSYTVVEAPAELIGAEEWNSLSTPDIVAGVDPQRVTIARHIHRHTLADLVRGDADDLGTAIEEIAAEAGTPVMAEAARRHLPRLLGLEPSRSRAQSAAQRSQPPSPIAFGATKSQSGGSPVEPEVPSWIGG